MIATVTIPPFRTLPPTEKLVAKALRDGAKANRELEDLLKRNYHSIHRALKSLEAKGWVELDEEMSGGKQKYYRLKQVPADGIELLINTEFDVESVSFNRYIETVARQLKGGRKPKVVMDAEKYFTALAMLGYFAGSELANKGSVNEIQLLELRGHVQDYAETLSNAYAIAKQVLDNENFWHADTLATGVMRKTDRYLSPSDMQAYAKIIIGSFGGPHEADGVDDPYGASSDFSTNEVEINEQEEYTNGD